MRNYANRPLKSAESNSDNWKRINVVERQGVDVANQAAQTRYATPGRPFSPVEQRFPFQIYAVPAAWRAVAAASTDWRTVIVRGGLVLESPATMTDGVADPYSETMPDSIDNEVIVPDDIEKFWFWLEIGETDGVTTAVVRFHSDPTQEEYIDGEAADEDSDHSWDTDNPWNDFPRPDGGHIPIGYVNTKTKRNARRILIRQILTTDLMVIGPLCP